MGTADEALARYDRFNDDCTAENYTDTGEAWQVLHILAAALRNRQVLDSRPSLGSPTWHEQQEDRCNPVHPDSPAGKGVTPEEYYGDRGSSEQDGCADPAHNGNCDEWHERDGNVGELIDRRVQVYGDPITGFADIAAMWSVYLDHTVQAYEVPIMMMLMKVVRSKTSPDYSDHSDDIEGYLDIFRKIIGDDMILARSVTEYIEKKWPSG